MQISRNVRYTNHVTGYHYCDHVTDTLFWKGEGGNILTFFTSRNFQFPTAASYHISHHIISHHRHQFALSLSAIRRHMITNT